MTKKVIAIIIIITSICAVFSMTFIFWRKMTKKEIFIPEIKENTYIYDSENIIDDEVQEYLNNILVSFEQQTSIEFMVVTVENLNGFDINQYANKLFNTLQIRKRR